MTDIVETIYKEAIKSFKNGEIPVGAAVTYKGKIVAKAHNDRQHKKDILGHAEINCLKKASKKIKDWRLDQMEMYVTLKPCKMCEEVIKQSRIKKVYYLCDSTYNNEHKQKTNFQKINNNLESKYKEILSKFFLNKR